MAGLNESKLNQLLTKLPQGVVAAQPWLSRNGIYRQLAEGYCKSGWLKKIGRGAFVRINVSATWMGGLYTIQKQLGLSIHVGGKTALQRQGLAHFLPIGGGDTVSLFAQPPAKLPKWFKDHDWGVNIQSFSLHLFDSPATLGLTQETVDQFEITISLPERAMMELLHLVPETESFEGAKDMMECLTTLRPELVQALLEHCRSIKVKRLFLFLAEECGHNWVHEVKLERVNLGEGKRVIVKGGRLDPIYNITVPNEPFETEYRQRCALENRRARSAAVRLMCPEKNIQLTFGKEHGYFASMLYLALESGRLSILDQLLGGFKIEQWGSPDFRGRLQEGWLGYVLGGDQNKIRKAANNTFSALIELVVAQHLKKKGAKIIDLEAWKESQSGRRPDIQYQLARYNRNAEIKYIDASPEFMALVMNELKTGTPEARSFGDWEFVNYFFGRIAEAAIQLEPYPYDTRQVWLVFNPQSKFERTVFEKNYLQKPCDWFANTNEQREVLKKLFGRKKIPEKHPAEWLKKISEVVLATFSSEWSLEDVKHYKTNGLVL